MRRHLVDAGLPAAMAVRHRRARMTDPPSLELAGLIEGYRRFRETGWTPSANAGPRCAKGQEPRIMVIACSDSRVDPAQIFDVDPGEIFVVRNVAAMVPPFETTPGHHGVSAALEFAVQVLKVREIVVMGHGMCGGCQRGADPGDARRRSPGDGGFIADWIDMLDEAREPIVGRTRHRRARGRTRDGDGRGQGQPGQPAHLPLRSQELEARGKLTLRGAFFAISDGVLHLLDEGSGDFAPVA